ncbi:hypothetical protein ElyMa_002644500 [Elysia marginata]|uniref:Uncharacterized protein n=1 Tax=Elysia marginata TaxID=1093978 RepID=A0AAV4H7C0_9GAST|nr:hypothetical protein ElyMa_002644500 [Elysia marginata]
MSPKLKIRETCETWLGRTCLFQCQRREAFCHRDWQWLASRRQAGFQGAPLLGIETEGDSAMCIGLSGYLQGQLTSYGIQAGAHAW